MDNPSKTFKEKNEEQEKQQLQAKKFICWRVNIDYVGMERFFYFLLTLLTIVLEQKYS